MNQDKTNDNGILTIDDLPVRSRAALEKMGISGLKPVQTGVYPDAVAGKDVLVQAPTGSGKTLALVLPLVEKLSTSKAHGKPRALVLCPTRELSHQVAEVFAAFSEQYGLVAASITGGASEIQQRRRLSKGCDVVIGTPGRVRDLAERSILDLGTVEIFALDEVDQMLDIGFKDDLELITSLKPEKSQTLFFSATLNGIAKKLCKRLLQDPAIFKMDCEQSRPQIEHLYMRVARSHETESLVNLLLLESASQGRAIVFCETKAECDDLVGGLQEAGLKACALHGDILQARRNATLSAFRERKIDFLVATNVAARGIDVQDLPLVVNFRLPHDSETYVHRVGRTARAGQKGRAITLVTSSSANQLIRYAKTLGIEMAECEVPSPAVIRAKSLELLRTRLGQNEGNSPSFVEESNDAQAERVWSDFRQTLSGDEVEKLLKKLVLSSAVTHPGFEVPAMPASSERPARGRDPRAEGFRTSPGRASAGKGSWSLKRDRFGGEKEQRRFGGERGQPGFGGDKPSRSFGSGDKPSRGFGSGDKPSRGFGSGDKPSRSFGAGDKPSRSFGSGDKPSRSFGTDDKAGRSFGRGEKFGKSGFKSASKGFQKKRGPKGP